MHTLEEVLEAARRLSEGERTRLVEKLQSNGRDEPTHAPRRDTLHSWLDLAGMFHSDFADVSTDKYRHLADVYADRT